jgi:hypothetical protein
MKGESLSNLKRNGLYTCKKNIFCIRIFSLDLTHFLFEIDSLPL